MYRRRTSLPPARADRNTMQRAGRSASADSSRRLQLAQGVDRVADATNRADEFRLETFVDLAADLADVDVDDVGESLEGLVPHPVHDHSARQDPVRIQHQVFEQAVFLRTQLDALAGA